MGAVEPGSLKGRLLVASPPLVDPNFDRSVVLLLEHGAEAGAVGLVLNRPSAVVASEALPEWASAFGAVDHVFVGGPVSPGSLIGLAERHPASPRSDDSAWTSLFSSIGTVDLGGQPADVPGLVRLRAFAGYAGWGPGQLEGELGAGAWIVAERDDTDAFTVEPLELWRAVLRRQPGRLKWLANFPPEAAHN